MIKIHCLFLFLLLPAWVYAQDENCAELGTGPGDELIKLIQAMKNDTLGGVPLFCRPAKKQANDTKMDEALSDFISQRITDAEKKTETGLSDNAILKVMQFVLTKNLWHVSPTDLRYKILLKKNCAFIPFNKLPIDTPAPLASLNPQEVMDQEEKILKRVATVCTAEKMTEIIPFLSKDVLAEGMFYLSEIYPHGLQQVATKVCESYEKSPEGLLAAIAEESRDKTYYREKDPNLMKGFSIWLKEIKEDGTKHSSVELDNKISQKKRALKNQTENQMKLPIVMEDPPTVGLELSIDDFFQDQGRKKKINEILSKRELKALRSYSGNGYHVFNSCLRFNECEDDIEDYIDDLVKGLDKIRRSQNSNKSVITYRGVADLPKEIKSILENAEKNQDSVVLDKGFMSTTGRLYVANDFRRVVPTVISKTSSLYIIKSKSCVGISELSHQNNEDEFLCPPNMKFKVKRLSGMSDTYVLEEVSQ